MDARAIISGSLAGVAIICGTVLAAMRADMAGMCFALASTFGGYVVGLYSEPVSSVSSEPSSSDGEDTNDEA